MKDQEGGAKKAFIPKSRKEIINSIRRILVDIGQESMLYQSNESSGMLSVLPTDARYNAQNHDEVIVLVVRAHVITMVPAILQVIGMLLLPFIVLYGITAVDASNMLTNPLLVLGIILFWFLFTFSFAFRSFLYWYYNVFIITNHRIIDIDYDGFVSSRPSGAPIQSVEDVTVLQDSIMGSIFNFGNVEFQTAGTRNEFELKNIPFPRVVQDLILDLKLGSEELQRRINIRNK